MKHVKPGHTIICDECMSAWKGSNASTKQMVVLIKQKLFINQKELDVS